MFWTWKEEKEMLKASKNITEANVQFNMVIALLKIGFDVRVEVVPIKYPETRFDVCVMDGENIIGVIEMKRETLGDMQEHERKFWNTEQGLRYRSIGLRHKIPVLYCAGPSEIDRVSREMKIALSTWYLKLLYKCFT
jgi:hypothetical protein